MKRGQGTTFVLAWESGGYAPEASAGSPRAPGNKVNSAGGGGRLCPRPFYEEINALWFQAERPGSQAMAALGSYVEPSFEGCYHP